MKQIIFILMMAVLPLGAMAQVDDLYFVPKKKQAKKEVKATTSSNAVKVAPATVSTPQNGTNVVRIGQKSNIVNGIDEDEYNRRSTPTYSTEQEYTEEDSYEYSDEQTYDETAIDGDYTYSSRIVRFHSPRRAVLLSSPLYWDVVYSSGLDNWTIYDDGIYWDVYPDYSYTTFYSSPWYYPSWRWSYGCGWGLSLGWYSPWHWGYHHHHHWHYPHYYYGGHHHYGHHIATGGWHRPFNGGYRNAIYSDRNGRGGSGNYVPRASGPSRADAGVRSGSVARNNKNAAVQSGRTVRKADGNVQRVYNRPSSTRNNATRNGVTNERTNSTRNNNATRVENGNRTNNTMRENSNGTKVQRPTRNTTQKKESVKSSSQNNNRSSVNNRTSSESRSSVTRSNNSSRSSNSRSSIGSQSRSSGFSGGGSRGGSGGGSRGGGSRGGGGGRR